MDVAQAFTFVTEDEQWVGKIGIGVLVVLGSFLIIPIPLLIGYQAGVTCSRLSTKVSCIQS